MPSDVSNDNLDTPRAGGADAHGEAAMLLLESLIHGLIEKDVLSVSDAVEIVDTASEVKSDLAADRGDPPVQLRRTLGLLSAVSDSLRLDLPPR